MIERRVIITNKFGLHARPCAEFVKLASTFASDVFVASGDTEVNGKSIMGVMMLAAAKGTRIRIRAEGSDEDNAIRALVDLVTGKFEEEE
ncbi:MAG: HPr family phosphocarrier protein [Candidatus Eisenbacteria sp.]|nr:HPr family phosphocarrier protein [Candidatus Eisenbacteria bacterium]